MMRRRRELFLFNYYYYYYIIIIITKDEIRLTPLFPTILFINFRYFINGPDVHLVLTTGPLPPPLGAHYCEHCGGPSTGSFCWSPSRGPRRQRRGLHGEGLFLKISSLFT